ncbi:hypothetical protein EDC03_3067 [Pseudokineococcus lusitanus]|uniref:Uncharacterized protein n=3 Tax=Actinomycetes TaxID=1760 RepID=A0A3N1G9A1_9ACTN|nr:hypothetical protein EDC03_3067 [Pseudokineococcus lusitanus]
MRRFDPRRDESGYALVAVLLTMLGLALFAMLAMTTAVRAAVPSRSVGDVVTATAAAQAGIEEYVARLAENSTYYNVNGTGDDASNKAFVVRRDGSSYGDGRDPRGVQVPGSGTQGAYFRYQLLTSPTETSRGGTIRLRVTGTTTSTATRPAESRTLTATLQQPGFLQYIYVTDVEAVDPSLYNTATVSAAVNGSGTRYTNGGSPAFVAYADPSAVLTTCAKRYYEGRNAPTYQSSASLPYWEQRYDYSNQAWRPTGGLTKSSDYGKKITFACQNIQFGGGDVITGALHSNDALLIGSSGTVTFQSPQTESSWADSATPAPAAGRRYWGAGTPIGTSPVYAPPLSLPKTNDDLRSYAGADGTGCTYTGETRITFVGASMKVLSPGTTSTQSGCLSTANRANEQTVPIPSVIYVKDSTATCAFALGYPRSGEDTSGTTTQYDCKSGTAFVQGEVKGQVTVATERDIVVTGDLTYASGLTGSDVVGLIPNNFVWVYNPVNASGNALAGYGGPVTIQAAILSLQHSFLVQNWAEGARRGNLTVDGVIAQKYRGAVGTSGSPGTGFTKAYSYDERLRYLPPPYFLTPESTPWSAVRVTDG